MTINADIKDRYRKERDTNAELKSQLKALQNSLSSSTIELESTNRQFTELQREGALRRETWERDKEVLLKLQQQLIDSERKYKMDVLNKYGIIQEVWLLRS